MFWEILLFWCLVDDFVNAFFTVYYSYRVCIQFLTDTGFLSYLLQNFNTLHQVPEELSQLWIERMVSVHSWNTSIGFLLHSF